MIDIVTQKMIAYFGRDVRRINHALKVFSFASTIARREKLSEEDILIVELAAILHDIGIKNAEIKYRKSSGKYQEIEGPPVAAEMLSELKLGKEVIDRICFLIGNHHSYQNIDNVDFQILVEADFLVNIDEDKMSEKSVVSAREKYFKTETGKAFLASMYVIE